MNSQLTEIMRLITNLIRTGIVTEVDRDGWLCRVKTGDLETNWINWLTYRAGNRTYANRSNAERAAKMNWERLQRGVASFSLQLAEGRADLYTEMTVKVSGFKQPIDDAEWTITTLTHTVSADSGFTTSIELEVKIDELVMG
ncbi:TPA: phage baseplate assembly protein V [Klebsiella pneumoniae]|nr:phage baseplate assembly protein V [Klebsiella pneumoniae]HBX8284036.1 phage baseplate assembly protein V [Klebsiella pneumoniae]HBZ7553623.1 phage baseplate assembly protein V [Klebsiella pneumoniae]HDH0181921.1 phage baseplate assembly protein V [Klebsiella pneumoniae]HDK6353334.1 phage baseplate assembly protein V [Klebsiella pneumoniae]